MLSKELEQEIHEILSKGNAAEERPHCLLSVEDMPALPALTAWHIICCCVVILMVVALLVMSAYVGFSSCC